MTSSRSCSVKAGLITVSGLTFFGGFVVEAAGFEAAASFEAAAVYGGALNGLDGTDLIGLGPTGIHGGMGGGSLKATRVRVGAGELVEEGICLICFPAQSAGCQSIQRAIVQRLLGFEILAGACPADLRR